MLKKNGVRKKLEAAADEFYNLQVRIQRLEEQLKPKQAELRELKASQDDERAKIRSLFIDGGFERLTLGKCMVQRVAGRPSVHVLDKGKVPKTFKKITVDIMKDKVMALYREEGKSVPGTEVVTGDPTVQITVEKG